MMQLTEAAWQDVTQLHYRQAFEWETNVEVGILYLARLKGMLESVDLFSYPRLAASYRYGYGALRKEKFMVSRMKDSGKSDLSKIILQASFPPLVCQKTDLIRNGGKE